MISEKNDPAEFCKAVTGFDLKALFGAIVQEHKGAREKRYKAVLKGYAFCLQNGGKMPDGVSSADMRPLRPVILHLIKEGELPGSAVQGLEQRPSV